MKGVTINTEALLAALSSLAGFPLQLRMLRTATGKPAALICPPDLKHLTQPFWLALRASDNQGIWDTPEQAVVGFAAEVAGWLELAKSPVNRPAFALLQQRLSSGPVAVAALLCEAADAGISRDRLGRAARSLGVARRKDGMRGGWLWELPAGRSAKRAPPSEPREGMA